MLKKLSLLIAMLFLLIGNNTYAQDGEALFKANCASCHKVDKKMTGPALMGVHDRWENEIEEMVAFVQNSQGYMKASRPKSDYAKKLFAEFNNTLMPPQPLKPEEIKAIFGYIEAYAPPVDPTSGGGAVKEPTVDPTTYYSILGLIGVLLGVCALLLLVIAIVIQAFKAKASGEKLTWENFRENTMAFFTNPFVAGVIALVVVMGVANSAIDLAANINFNHYYQPAQPIAFSHKIHAGQYEIDCKYCHIGVEKGKNATIPSTNICMNCHNAIEEGAKTGTTEIAKIHESFKTNKPIEWVKIHNLPDLVYFSHAQHVKVAGLECQECHGPVETMDEVYQYSKLNMGWCVSCHREKEIDINKNDYYRSVHQQLREDQASGKLQKITVEKLGGLECARCHY